MSLALAAVAAVVAALLQTSVVPFFEIGGASPDLVLVVVLLWAAFGGLDGAMLAAFVGGIVVDALMLRPLGSTSFALLVAAGAMSLVGRLGTRARLPLVVVAAFGLAVSTALLEFLVYGALAGPIPAPDPIGSVLPDAIYTTVIFLAALPIVVALHRRFGEQERVAW
jgi:rod shape-determining protein MreD